ncbi:unnamed protein product, partial [marine sediment metagenome]
YTEFSYNECMGEIGIGDDNICGWTGKYPYGLL